MAFRQTYRGKTKKKNEKFNKFSILPENLKKLWNIQVGVISFAFNAFGTFPKKNKKRKELKIRGRI